jgi:hypothetical protein
VVHFAPFVATYLILDYSTYGKAFNGTRGAESRPQREIEDQRDLGGSNEVRKAY